MQTLLKKTKSLKKQRILQHIIFWIAYILFNVLVFGSFYDAYLQSFAEVLILIPTKIAATYFMLYFLFPFIFKQKYLHFTFILSLVSVCFALMQHTAQFLISYIFYPKDLEANFFVWGHIFYNLIGVYSIVGVASSIKLLKKWFHNQTIQKRLEQEKLKAELQFLKSQIHPHFLFNTLNNLYALCLKKSDKAPEMVLKLSELLSYMLYECNSPFISLEKEIELINNYIELEKIRHDDSLKIDINISGDTENKKIAPLIILPFVENSFKHGANCENGFVEIDLKINEDNLELKVKNSKNKNYKTEQKGIGLKNIKRRLELIYSDESHLEIIDKNHCFLVTLKIKTFVV